MNKKRWITFAIALLVLPAIAGLKDTTAKLSDADPPLLVCAAVLECFSF
ncbi:MAG: hypothetical protein IH991_15335, partial [Planctomycetes bacterium]|nr:hypothetical protein [Planctomycetota bacterium]